MPWLAALAAVPLALALTGQPAPTPSAAPTALPQYATPDVPPPPVLRLTPGRLQVIRAGHPRADVALPRGSALDLATLPGLLAKSGLPDPDDLATMGPDGVLSLRATLDQQAGTRVTGGPPALESVRLGPGARLLGEHAELTLTGVTVQAGASSMADVGATLSYEDGSHLSLAGTALDGTQPSPATEQDGIRVAGGSTAKLDGVTVAGADTGIDLDDVGAVELHDVTVERGAGAGILVHKAAALTLQRVLTQGDVGVGLSLRGPIGTLSTSAVRSVGNQGPGIWLEHLDSLTVSDLSTAANTGPGTELTGSRSVDLTGIHSDGDVIGLSVTGSSVVNVHDLTTIDSSTGVSVAHSQRVGITHVLLSGAGDAAVDQDAGLGKVTLADVRTTGTRAARPAPRRRHPWMLVVIAVVVELEVLRQTLGRRQRDRWRPADYQIRTR